MHMTGEHHDRSANPRLRIQHEAAGLFRSGWSARRRADHGQQGPRHRRAYVFRRVQRDRLHAIRECAQTGRVCSGRPPNTWNIHLQSHEDLLWSSTPRTCSRRKNSRTRRNTTKASSAKRSAPPMRPRRIGTGRQGWRSMTSPNPADTAKRLVSWASKAAACTGIWYVGGRWAYASVAVGRLHRLHLRHHRHGRPNQSQGRRVAIGCPA